MPLWKIMYPRWKDLPPVTMLLALSCLVVSVPLFFSQELYAVLGYDSGLGHDYWKLITSSFAHGGSGSMVVPAFPHFLGNFAAIMLLGALIERVLGSGRFFLLTLATFTTHTIWKVGWGGGNGASGFCWGYVVLAAPILFWEWQKRKKQVFRDPLYVGIVLLAAFMVVGVPTVLAIEGRDLWNDNGTNQAHAISMLTALPFVFLWWNVMRANWQQLQKDEPIDRGHLRLNTSAVIASLFLLAFNVAFAAIGIRALESGVLVPPQVVSMTPQSGDRETLNQYNHQVTIRFDKPMAAQVRVERTSILQIGDEILDYSYHWEDPQTLMFVFTREVREGETILLITDPCDERWGMVVPVEMKFE